MKKQMIAIGLLSLLWAPGMVAPAHAQPKPPAPPAAAGEDHHAQLAAAVQKLNLKPKQKLELAKILKNAKASGQDKKTTMEQVLGVLTPEQKKQLMEEMKEKAGK